MGLLRRLLGRNDADADDPNAALDELEAIRTLMATDRAKAAKRLWRAGNRFHARFGLGAPDHDVYRAAHQALHAAPTTASADVSVTSYGAIGDEATVGDVVGFAGDLDVPLLLVRLEHPRYAHGAGAELEALALLDAHPEAALVAIGDADLLVRVDFLKAIDPPERVASAVEVPQELTDLARAQGRTWLAVAP